MRKPDLWLTIILNKHLNINARYLAIKYSKTTTFGIQEEQILFLLDTKFSFLPVQNDQIVNI